MMWISSWDQGDAGQKGDGCTASIFLRRSSSFFFSMNSEGTPVSFSAAEIRSVHSCFMNVVVC